MKKSVLLVIFSFVLVFGATLAVAAVDVQVPVTDSSYQDEEFTMDTNGPTNPGNEGDPDGYKEGWDSEILPNGVGLEAYDLPWEELLNLWLLLSAQCPF